MHRLTVGFGCLLAGLVVSTTTAFAQQDFAVGSHIEVDPSGTGQWQGGTLLDPPDKYKGYHIMLDAGYDIRVPSKTSSFPPRDYVRAAGANPAANAGAAGNAGGNANAQPVQNAMNNGVQPPQRAQQPAVANRQIMPAQVRADGPLTEEIVKRLIKGQVFDRPGATHSYQWGQIHIAAPRPSNNRDVYEAVPFGVQVYEVQAEYTETLNTGMGAFPIKHDHRQTYSFWKDATGNWTMQMKSVPSNFTSQEYH